MELSWTYRCRTTTNEAPLHRPAPTARACVMPTSISADWRPERRHVHVDHIEKAVNRCTIRVHGAWTADACLPAKAKQYRLPVTSDYNPRLILVHAGVAVGHLSRGTGPQSQRYYNPARASRRGHGPPAHAHLNVRDVGPQ